MSVRSRAAVLEAPPGAQVVKAYGNAMPPAMIAAEERARMTPASPFAPGPPLGPYEGYDRTPRATPFVTGYNIATRPRTHERVSFETLKGLIDSYDISQICINHRIDGIRALDWKLVGADDFSGDPGEYIPIGMKALDKPDRVHYWETWLGKWLWDELAYGCGPLYRLRNRAGRCIGLLPVDCVTIAPLLDYWGLPPGAMEQGTLPDADLPPSHVQYVNGVPWNWLTRADLIYEPFRLHNDSPYGRAPIESIILNANTDIRFQLFFLQTFTDGNLPAAFASSPETWTPDQIQQFQAYWDSFMYGDQSRKHQIRWLPPGSKFEWSNEKEFKDQFSLFLMRKTCASYHVVPTDIGFTENSNYSTGESQADVAHRIGDLPFIRYVQRILTSFLQNDLRLPLKFLFDLGEEQADQVNQANADKIYVDMGAVSASKIAEMRYGIADPVPIPRYIMTSRGGPVPISSLLAVAGEIDPETGLPAAGAPLPKDVFGGAEGVLPVPPIVVTPLAERLFGPDAMPPKPPPQPQLQDSGKVEAGHVAKEGGGAAAAGITAETGIYSYDLQGQDDEDEDGYPLTAAVLSVAGNPEGIAKEIAAFKRFTRARRRAGEWRDFRFDAVPAGEAQRLNDEGRASVAKAASGYDLSPRSGMISLDLPDGLIEPVPGGIEDFHVTVVYLGPDVSDEAFALACSRAQAAAASMPGPLSGTVSGTGCFAPSASSDGKVPAWAAVALPGAEQLRAALEDLSASEFKDWQPHVTRAYLQPGDPLPPPLPPTPVTFGYVSVHRGDQVERFPLGPQVTVCCGGDCCSSDSGCCDGDGGCGRSTGLNLTSVEPVEGDESTCPCGTPVVYEEANGWQHADGSVSHEDGESVSDKMTEIAKAGGARPKSLSAPEDWPGWARDLTLSGIYADRIREALRDSVDTRQLAEDWARLHPPADAVAKASLPSAVTAFLAAARQAIEGALRKVLPSAWAEAWVLGQQSAQASAAAAAAKTPREASAALKAVDWAGWQPGDPEAAYQVAGSGLRDLLASQDVQIKSIASSRLEELGDVLAEHLSSPETSGPVTYSVDSLANALQDVLDNPARAETVAVNEIARAQSAAASWVFQQMGVTLVRVSTAGDTSVCPICIAAEKAGAQPIGTYTIPIHVRCRCAMCAASPPLTPLASIAGSFIQDS